MTTTHERSTVVRAPNSRRPWLMIGMAVFGLLIGLLGGWLFFGTEDVITVDGSALTARQTEMVAMMDDAFAAWQDNDVDTVLSYYTETGAFVTNGVDYRVADGGLANFVRSFFGASNMESVGPEVVVDNDTVVSFHTYQGVTYTNVFDFTSSGDVLIARHEVTN